MGSEGYSLVAVHGLFNCGGFSRFGAQALGHMGLAVVVHKLNCSWHVESSKNSD